jgi:type II secretory pathway pseudopilin PulG
MQKQLFINRRNKNLRGFTLVELILYIALVSLFLAGAILFSWDVIYGREKSIRSQIVQQTIRIAMAKVGYEIRASGDIQSISSNQLVLNKSGVLTTIDLSNNRIRITRGALGPYFLTSNQVKVTNLTFTNLSTPDLNTKNIKVAISGTQSNSAVKGELTSGSDGADSFELKSEFNVGRKVLISTSGENLISGITLQGLTVQAGESTNAVIDKMFISWSGVQANRRITSVQIAGGTAEWTGSSATGSTLELTNFTLIGGAAPSTLTLTFNQDMTNALVNFYFVMTDGSFSRAQVSLAPPTYASCGQVCVSSGYIVDWTCRATATACTSAGEVNVSAGNTYCTGGGNGDTCCCK